MVPTQSPSISLLVDTQSQKRSMRVGFLSGFLTVTRPRGRRDDFASCRHLFVMDIPSFRQWSIYVLSFRLLRSLIQIVLMMNRVTKLQWPLNENPATSAGCARRGDGGCAGQDYQDARGGRR